MPLFVLRLAEDGPAAGDDRMQVSNGLRKKEVLDISKRNICIIIVN